MNELVVQAPLYTDDNAELSMIADDASGIPLEATRYIFSPGDYLDPARKDQLPHLRRGGEELLSNPCLRRTTNRFLPRCAITPLEFWGEELAWDLFPKEGVSVRAPIKLRGVVKQESAGRLFPELFFYPHYPGELIRDAIDAGNESRGIAEITWLRNVDWETGEAQAIQNTIFPADWLLPRELRLVEERINKAADENTSSIKDICGEMLDACDKFRRYGLSVIGRENTQIAQRVAHIHVYSYSPKCRSFAEQLEVKLTASTSDTIGAEVVKALAEAGNRPLDERSIQVISVAVAEAVKQALAQPRSEPVAAPVVESATERVKDSKGRFLKKGTAE